MIVVNCIISETAISPLPGYGYTVLFVGDIIPPFAQSPEERR